ncbi:MAG: 3-oxoacyl-[acyl-carrier-protein] reductase [Sphingobacteriales bacterium]|nr:3-oxoacyl-[acyl-carrier-protein] reductase [Sphingobacteriales bacterium]
MPLLSGKTALITGASRGIGEAIALLFAQQGAQVAFTYRSSADKAAALEAKMSDLGVKAKGYCSNAASFTEAEQLVQQVLSDFGTIDILVNNAGITRDNLLLRMSENDWDTVMENNLKSVFNLTKHVIRTMMKQRSGSIINLSSIVGIRGQAGQANYAASKAGVVAFSKSVAQEMGSRNIRCNVIAPGFIETDMTAALNEDTKKSYLQSVPLQRFGTGEDVAKVALFLASDLSSYVNGQTISVCGGML